ncbi:MAG: hypothetical protein AAB802_04450, partial [Patescibacteria group bacterium]
MKSKKPANYQIIGLIGRANLQPKAAYIKKLAAHLEKKNCELIWDKHITEILGKKNQHERAHILKTAN